MALSISFCPNNTNNMFLKIVHPGGHAELHDRPVLASQVMLRNPRCCVAYPNVFQQPAAIVAPETILMLGHKYYVVPMNTIHKLQRLSPKKSPPPAHSAGGDHDNNDRRGEKEKEIECLGEGDCFICLFTRIKVNHNDSCPEMRPDEQTRKRAMEFTGKGIRRSPKRRVSFDHWQPSLESIEEE